MQELDKIPPDQLEAHAAAMQGQTWPPAQHQAAAQPLPAAAAPSSASATASGMKEELYPLPSCGFGSRLPLIGGDSIRIRPMLVGDQRRASSAGGDPYAIYQRLLSKTITAPTMDIYLDEMLLSDATAALWAIRSMTWGPGYRMDFPCSGCKAIRNQEFDTNSLQVRYASDIEGYRSEDIEIELSAEVVTIHLPKMKDQKNLASNVARLQKQRLIDDPELDKPFVQYASYIDTINGKPASIETKFQFLDNLYQTDFDKIVEILAEKDSGILPNQTILCNRCGQETEVALTVTPEFFRPTRDRS